MNAPLFTARRIAAADLAELLSATAALGSARTEAAALLENARAEAATLLENARRTVAEERAAMERQVQERGARLLEQAKAEAAALRVVETVDAAARLTARFDALSPWIGELVIGTASRLVGAFEPDERMRRLLEQAIAGSRRDWDLRLRCHPGSAPLLQSLIDQDVAEEGRLHAVTGIVEDSSLAPGDCLLESAGGLVDISLAAQVAELRRALGLAEAAPTAAEPETEAEAEAEAAAEAEVMAEAEAVSEDTP